MRRLIFILLLFFTICSWSKGFVTHCTITTYNATAKQCDSTPDITADGTKIDYRKLKDGTLRIVAVSRDLLPFLPYGTEIEIEGHGRYVVADTMHERWEHRIDILQHHTKKNFMKKNIKVKKL